MANEDPGIIGTPEDRKRSVRDAGRGINYGTSVPNPGDEVKGLIDKLKEYADPDLAERIDGAMETGEKFLSGLPDYFKDALEKSKDLPSWQKVGVLIGAVGTLPVVFREQIGDVSDDFLKFYYGALARSPWPFGQYPMGDEPYRNAFYEEVLRHKDWGYIAIGVDSLDFLPGISEWYHEHRPAIDVRELPVPFLGSLLRNTVGVLRIDLLDLAIIYQIAKETGTADYSFKSKDGLTKTLLLTGIESIQSLGLYKIFPDASYGFNEAIDRVARTRSGYEQRSRQRPQQEQTDFRSSWLGNIRGARYR